MSEGTKGSSLHLPFCLRNSSSKGRFKSAVLADCVNIQLPPILPREICRGPLYEQPFAMRKRIIIEVFNGHHRINQWASSDLLFAVLSKVIPIKPLERTISSSKNICPVNLSDGQHVSSSKLMLPVSNHDHYVEKRGFRSRHKKQRHFNDRHIQQPESSTCDDLMVGLLTQRDLRQLYVSDTNSQTPAIEVRRGCIVICLPPVTCILLYDGAYIIANEDFALDPLIELLSKLTQRQSKKREAVTGLSQNTAAFSSSYISRNSATDVDERDGYIPRQSTSYALTKRQRRASYDSLLKPLVAFKHHLYKSQHHLKISQSAHDVRTVEDLPTEGSRNRSIFQPVSTAGDLSPRAVEFLENLNNQQDHTDDTKSDRSTTAGRGENDGNVKKPTKRKRYEVPFEFKALEAVIVTSFAEMSSDIQTIENELSQFHGDNSHSRPFTLDMEMLHGMKAPIDICRNRVKQMDNAFDDLLADPEDMKRMELSRYFKHPELYEVQRMHEAPNPDLELLLEYFGQEADNYGTRLKQMSQSVEHIERLLSLKLAVSRNRLIQLDLAATIVGVGIAVGTAMTGVFGMNMPSSLESSHKAFLATSIIVAATIICSCISVGVLLCKSKL